MSKKTTFWDDRWYIRCYELAKNGLTNKQIGEVLGLHHEQFTRFIQKRPALEEALQKARDKTNHLATFRDYVFHHLPEELQDLWERIQLCDQVKGGFAQIEALLSGRPVHVRQNLFLYALVSTCFDVTQACRLVNVTHSQLHAWRKDYEFAQLMEHIHHMKGDYFESALFDLINNGDSQAVLFANRTFNRNRGYGEKVTVEQTGTVNHNHHIRGELTLEQLEPYMSLDVKKGILEAIRKKQECELQVRKGGDNVVEVQITPRLLPPVQRPDRPV